MPSEQALEGSQPVQSEPIYDIAHLGHVEVLTPKFEESRKFFIDVMGMSSRPRDFHPQALPEPYVNLSIHTAPDVRPLPWHRGQWARRLGFARRNRSNQSLAPLV